MTTSHRILCHLTASSSTVVCTICSYSKSSPTFYPLNLPYLLISSVSLSSSSCHSRSAPTLPLIPLPFLLFSSFSTFRMPYPGILLKYLFPHTISHIPVFTNAWEYAHASIMLRVDEVKRFLYPYNSLTEQQPPYTIQLKERRLLSEQKVISIAYLKHI